MKKLISSLTFLFLLIQSFGQTPDMYPPPKPKPVEINTLNIILYIVLPILLIIVFFLYRRSLKKRNRKNSK